MVEGFRSVTGRRPGQSGDVCGISFHEFRTKGRLGCPHDYTFFERELMPLIMNIHGETKHVGKRARRSEVSMDEETDVIRLRREMKEATQKEEYELAAKLRDDIRKIEQRKKHPGKEPDAPDKP